MPQNNMMPHDITGRPGPNARLYREKTEIKDVKGTLKRIIIYLGKRWHILLIIFFCALVTTLITIIGIQLNGYTFDEFISNKDIAGLARICIIMILIYLVSAFSTYMQNFLMIRVAQKTSASIRSDLFSSLQKLPLNYFDTHSSGDLMSRLTNDVDNINLTLSQSVMQLFSGVVSIVGMLVAMLLLSPLLTLIGLLTTPLMFFTSKVLAIKSQKFFTEQQSELGRLNGYIEEMVSGQKVVKVFSREKEVEGHFKEINEKLVSSSIKAQAISSVMGPVNNTINNLTYLIITVCGGILIIKGVAGITVGVIFSFLLYMRNFTQPINNILNLFSTIQSAIAGAERVFEVMDEEKEKDVDNARDIKNIEGNVEIDSVNFSYIPGKPILKEATISAKKGQKIAIVGPTGAGKTTIINLLTRFYDIDSGAIYIDGQNINAITRKSLRQSISMVLQDTFLFSDTIRENIHYGKLTATDEEVEQAAKLAHAHDFIMQLPQGYDTILTDNGGNLSQGQRQLLSIARAMIAQSSVLILDEATSSIDTRTELIIQSALLKLMRGKTSFVIAHRLSTIKNADKIIVLDGGRVVETGTHRELLVLNGFYANLYNSQFKKGMAI
ncbi:MAG TPA: ABC transporter ATP-binding protein [Methanosarcina sp.]